MARTILVAVKDLLFGSKIQEAGKRSDTKLLWASRFEKLRDVALAKDPDVIIADLSEPGIVDELAAAKVAKPALRILGFTGHTQEHLIADAQARGVDEVFTKGQFSAQVEKILVRERDAG